jgi:hypothetical protein
MKMRWDDTYLYIAAHLASDLPVLAKFTKQNEPIFTEDSDFEVFVDPAATTHAYKELEINALNTVWNLMLNRSRPNAQPLGPAPHLLPSAVSGVPAATRQAVRGRRFGALSSRRQGGRAKVLRG